MSLDALYWLAAIVAGALAIYLVLALVNAEDL